MTRVPRKRRAKESKRMINGRIDERADSLLLQFPPYRSDYVGNIASVDKSVSIFRPNAERILTIAYDHAVYLFVT